MLNGGSNNPLRCGDRELAKASHMHYAPRTPDGTPYACQVEGCTWVARTFCTERMMMLCEQHADSDVIEGLVFES